MLTLQQVHDKFAEDRWLQETKGEERGQSGDWRREEREEGREARARERESEIKKTIRFLRILKNFNVLV